MTAIDIDGQTHWMGKYRGFVTRTDDPKKQYRLKMTIPDVLQTEESPWALPALPPIGSLLPNPGDMVWVEFEMGLASRPIWSGGFPSAETGSLPAPDLARGVPDDTVKGPQGRIKADLPDGEMQQPPPAYNADYGPNRVWRTPGGHLVEMDDTPGRERVRILHSAGGLIEFVGDGSIRVFGMNLDETVRRDRRVHVGGSETVKVEGPSTEVHNGLRKETYQKRREATMEAGYQEDVTGERRSTVGGKRVDQVSGRWDMSAGASMGLQAVDDLKLGAGGSLVRLVGGAESTLVGNARLDVYALDYKAVLGNVRFSALAGIADIEGILIRLGGLLGVHPVVLGDALLSLFNSHTHSGVESGGSSTGPPNQQMAPGTHTSLRVFTA